MPSKDWEEIVKPDERALIDSFLPVIRDQQIKAAQETSAQGKTGKRLRGFHAKTHAGLMAEFQVLPDLPEPARFGVFSEPRIFQALVRFSNGEPSTNPDKHAEPRGIGIKLIGVPGRKLLEGQEDALTQDFLATSHSVTSTVRNVGQFIAFIRASHNRLTLPFTLARSVGIGEAFRLLWAFARTVPFSKVKSMVTEEYSSTAPIKCGPYAVKFTVKPAAGTAAPVKRPRTPNFLREELADRLRKGDLMLDFWLQFFEEKTITPIEDTSVRWMPENAPFVKVAQLRIPSCDLDDPATDNLSKQVSQLAFTPWHTTEDHRPLGNVMRARRIAYQASSSFRHHNPEPTSLPLLFTEVL
jgi:hypothetical protein